MMGYMDVMLGLRHNLPTFSQVWFNLFSLPKNMVSHDAYQNLVNQVSEVLMLQLRLSLGQQMLTTSSLFLVKLIEITYTALALDVQVLQL